MVRQDCGSHDSHRYFCIPNRGISEKSDIEERRERTVAETLAVHSGNSGSLCPRPAGEKIQVDNTVLADNIVYITSLLFRVSR